MPSKKPAPKEVLKMDTKPQSSTASTGKKTEVKVDAPEIDSESLVVHVDDTQNDLDADLINSKDDTGATQTEGKKEVESKDEKPKTEEAKPEEMPSSKDEPSKENLTETKEKETSEKTTDSKTDKKPEDKKEEKDTKSATKRSVWFV
jgi:hypothetical protein